MKKLPSSASSVDRALEASGLHAFLRSRPGWSSDRMQPATDPVLTYVVELEESFLEHSAPCPYPSAFLSCGR